MLAVTTHENRCSAFFTCITEEISNETPIICYWRSHAYHVALRFRDPSRYGIVSAWTFDPTFRLRKLCGRSSSPYHANPSEKKVVPRTSLFDVTPQSLLRHLPHDSKEIMENLPPSPSTQDLESRAARVADPGVGAWICPSAPCFNSQKQCSRLEDKARSCQRTPGYDRSSVSLQR